ncbi:hypothetical protein V1291_000461 [Nitrobacteraceae bacterium AZCC 1564]
MHRKHGERFMPDHDDWRMDGRSVAFSTSVIHHFALRVEDVEAGKKWLTTTLGLRVEREFQIAGNDFVFLSPGGAKAPVIELIGGPVESERQLPENIPDMMKLAGWHHICLQVVMSNDAYRSCGAAESESSSTRPMVCPRSAWKRLLSSPIHRATSTSCFNSPMDRSRQPLIDRQVRSVS